MTELSGPVKKGASTTTRAFPPATGINSALKSTIEESQESDRKPHAGGAG